MTKKLSDFLIELSNDHARIEAFQSHPGMVLDQSGLDEQDQELVKSGDVEAIQEKIQREEIIRPETSGTAVSIVLPEPIQDPESPSARSAISIVLPQHEWPSSRDT